MKKNRLIDIGRIKSRYDISIVFRNMNGFAISFPSMIIRFNDVRYFVQDWIKSHFVNFSGDCDVFVRPSNGLGSSVNFPYSGD